MTIYAATIQEAITTFALGIFLVSKARDGLPKQAGIAIEGPFFGIPDVAHACTYLMGLIYALELRLTMEMTEEDSLNIDGNSGINTT
ncbi:hypothetical protein AALO_G00300840 [Alosa alosa]|uniref:Uncharacterized protein n=1 Tax=Alosa alosa TaxID=278164 RepID=A0AAV6FEG0_9TELE|nr:hypothetical protein AALO_G00300840 [Alosa alosa]